MVPQSFDAISRIFCVTINLFGLVSQLNIQSVHFHITSHIVRFVYKTFNLVLLRLIIGIYVKNSFFDKQYLIRLNLFHSKYRKLVCCLALFDSYLRAEILFRRIGIKNIFPCKLSLFIVLFYFQSLF